VLALFSAALSAQTAYKYKDANGQWVFTDRATSSAGADNSFTLEHQDDTLHIDSCRQRTSLNAGEGRRLTPRLRRF
jgi:hypothetical protein